jgi:hypothetical protein
MPSYDDPFGFDDDEEISFNPEEFQGKTTDIDDLDQLWEFSFEDYDYEDFITYEFHGTGDTG